MGIKTTTKWIFFYPSDRCPTPITYVRKNCCNPSKTKPFNDMTNISFLSLILVDVVKQLGRCRDTAFTLCLRPSVARQLRRRFGGANCLVLAHPNGWGCSRSVRMECWFCYFAVAKLKQRQHGMSAQTFDVEKSKPWGYIGLLVSKKSTSKRI